MDAFGSAMKSKMKGKSSPPATPMQDDQEKAEMDMAPDLDDKGDAEISNLKSMGAGTPIGGNPKSLGARAKGKMNERMASIMKEKKAKGQV